TSDGFFFAVYPKRSGREIEIDTEESWRRIGSLIARVHSVGDYEDAPHRIMHHPLETTGEQIDILLDGDYIAPQSRKPFAIIADRLMELIVPLFEEVEFIRIHGDCHRGNILERPGEGLMLIDFDDMMVGPPVQDLWLLLPDHALESRREIAWLLEGYTMLRDFDRRTLRLIEPLRAMRMIYFLAWIARQTVDFNFAQRFEGWGTDAFWRREVIDLEQQYVIIRQSLQGDLPV
ncbi:MAG: serine/threonine protein kinase, partial [Victivallales bacterium]|nr:serine/threonine protein kinase [Victivallales bacterium]